MSSMRSSSGGGMVATRLPVARNTTCDTQCVSRRHGEAKTGCFKMAA